MVDNLITLFESTDTDFSTNGIGPLPDAISCTVTEEANGPYEMEMEYPISGRFYDEIQFRRILLVKPNPYSNRQPFRIYSISKPISGRVTVNAQHISYDLSNYTVSPFAATNVEEAFNFMTTFMDNVDGSCPFTFWTDKNTVADMKTTVPLSARSILGGIEGSILDTYRGEYEWDGYTVKLWNVRGGDHSNSDRGVSIRYGKNLTDLKQEENISEVYTAVRPFWHRETTQSVITKVEIDGETVSTTTEEVIDEYVELTNTVSSNLIIDSIKYGDNEDLEDTTINDDGEIVSGSTNYKMMYAKVEAGVNYTIRCDSETTVVGGFFSTIPDVGSVATGGKEDITMSSFTPQNDGYVAIRVGIEYTSSVIDRLPYNIMFVDAYSEYNRIMPLDLTSEFQDKPSEDALAIAALLYVNEHDIGSPKVSLEVSFLNLSNASEYGDIALLEMVKLFDTVDIIFPKLGVNATAKVVKTIYNVLSGRYNSIELGSTKANLSTTISEAKKISRETVTTTQLSRAISEATRLITGQTGGYVVMNPSDSPQEILILDAQSGGNIEDAVNLWRWNSAGLAHSSTGYRGIYTTAITAEGSIVADFINSGTMSADQILGGTLVLGRSNGDGEEARTAGSLIVYNGDTVVGTFNKDGLTLWGQNGFYLLASPGTGFAGMQMAGSTPSPSTDTKVFWVSKDEFHMRRAVVEQDITFCGKMKFVPMTRYNSSSAVINDGIALVDSTQ